MALKIFWTKRALNSFENILNYIEKEFGEPATKSFAIKVHNSAITPKALGVKYE